jgi:hypothetical protein
VLSGASRTVTSLCNRGHRAAPESAERLWLLEVVRTFLSSNTCGRTSNSRPKVKHCGFFTRAAKRVFRPKTKLEQFGGTSSTVMQPNQTGGPVFWSLGQSKRSTAAASPPSVKPYRHISGRPLSYAARLLSSDTKCGLTRTGRYVTDSVKVALRIEAGDRPGGAA